MSEKINPKDCYFYIRAKLECEAEIQIFQRIAGLPWELIITPKPGTKVGDFARLVDNELRINMFDGSAIGIYQLFHLILSPPRRKKFLGLL